MNIRKARRITLSILLAAAAAFLAAIYFIAADNSAGTFAARVAGIALLIAAGLFDLSYSRCPECNAHIERLYGDHCPKCGSLLDTGSSHDGNNRKDE